MSITKVEVVGHRRDRWILRVTERRSRVVQDPLYPGARGMVPGGYKRRTEWYDHTYEVDDPGEVDRLRETYGLLIKG